MSKRVKLATALNRTMEQRGGPGEPSAKDSRTGLGLVPTDSAEPLGSITRRRGFGLAPVGRALSGAIYGVGYYGSFGVVFGAMTLWHLLPLNNAFGRGLRDGGRAGHALIGRAPPGAAAGRAARSRNGGRRERGREAVAV